MLEWLNLYRADVQHVASLLLGLAMWRYGAGPERALGVVFAVLVILPAQIGRWADPDMIFFGDLSWLYALSDSLAACAFVAIALNANRNYPLWVAGFQLVAISAYAVRSVFDAVSPIAYAILAVGPSYCQLALLLAGFARHSLRKRRFGPYREWRLSLPGAGWLGLAYPRRGGDV